MSFCVKLTKEAYDDVEKVYDYLNEELYAPAAAENFLRGIYSQIACLETLADVFAVSVRRDVLL